MKGEKENVQHNKQQFSFIHTADLHLDSPFLGISDVDPDFVIPVHTTGNRWFTDNFDNVKIMEKGIEYGF